MGNPVANTTGILAGFLEVSPMKPRPGIYVAYAGSGCRWSYQYINSVASWTHLGQTEVGYAYMPVCLSGVLHPPA